MTGETGGASASGRHPAHVLAHLPDGVVVLDEQARFVDANAAALDIFGLGRGELLARTALDVLHPDDVGRALQGLGASATYRTQAGQYRVVRPDGSAISVWVAAASLPGDEGELVLTLRYTPLLSSLDVALQAVAGDQPLEEALAIVAGALSAPDWFGATALAFDVAPTGSAPGGDVAADGRAPTSRRAWAPGAGRRAVGPSVPPELDGRDLGRWPWSEAVDSGAPVVAGSLRQLDEPSRAVAEAAGFYAVSVVPVPDPLGRPLTITTWYEGPSLAELLAGLVDPVALPIVTLALRQRAATLALEHAALHDPLTGLPNRARFFQALATALTDAAGAEVAVLFVDLDRFKPVNDTYGHGAGDQVLIEVGHRLRSAVRPDDVVARIGGDEFVILCPTTPPGPALDSVADRILEVVRHPMTVHPGAGGEPVEVTVGVSVGVAVAADADELIAAADQALYEAKAAGRNRWSAAPRPDR